MDKKCLVCKQALDDQWIRQVDGGYVHEGECYRHYQEIKQNLTESAGNQQLQETELLL